jgi:DNA-binding NtrC family response regulator
VRLAWGESLSHLGEKMARRLLIVDSQSPSDRVGFGGISDNFVYERIDWSPQLALSVRERAPDLLIVVALSAPERAAELLISFQRNPIAAPTLAIMPTDAADELISLASRVLDDFMFAPVRAPELQGRIERIIGGPTASDTIDQRMIEELTMAGLVGCNSAFLRTVGKIPVTARSRGPVLITGETGTGKELVARALHMLGPRRDRPFVPVDCATLPEQLFESELFGHMRGTFTGANQDHKGLVNLANSGTLFLDEIDALSLGAQSKLLRLIQERAYRPLGFGQFIKVDASIVAATNGDLREFVQIGKFRADLFFRLSVFCLDLVPLRQRRDDIALLARHFVTRACDEHRIPRKSLASTSIRKLCEYDWPGNVRELFNVIQRAVLFSDGSVIGPSYITDVGIDEGQSSDKQIPPSFREARLQAIESFERQYVGQLMLKSGGNVSLAARLANKERRAFGRMVKRYGIKGLDSTGDHPVADGRRSSAI